MVYTTKKTKRLYNGRLLKRFLKDEDGAVNSLQLHCLKPKVRSSTILEDTPDHLPDISIFPVHDIIDARWAIKGHSHLRKKMNIPDHDSIENMFNKISGLNRLALVNMM